MSVRDRFHHGKTRPRVHDGQGSAFSSCWRRRAHPARLPGCVAGCVASCALGGVVGSLGERPLALYYVDARCRLGFWLSAVARSPGLYLLRPTGEREIRGLIDLIRIQEGEVWKQGFELRAEQASVACISWMMRGAVQESRNSMALQEKILDQSLRKLVAGPPERLDTSLLFLF